ncbi:tetratricopeptide repeat protein [Akkermansia muciniphila]|uniref:tetratricopeptide repeat protein n=1 Tax=Akkermansia muciniphila TaxID=239935 RepID=UPI0033AD3935
MDEEKLQEELEKWEREIVLDPENFTAYVKKGNVLDDLGRSREALDSYNKALEINPAYDKAYCNRGIVLKKLGRQEEALSSYDKSLEINPRNDAAHYNRGYILNDLGRKEEALVSYGKALQINPEDYAAYYNKGNILNDLKRKEEALDSYDKALEIKPDYDKAYCNRGIILKSLGRKEEALSSYNKALEANPGYDAAYYNRGNVLDDLGRKEEALASYNKALEINPDYGAAYYNRGNVLDDLGRKEEALASYNKALEINPHHDASLNNKGLLLSGLGKREEALACYIQAIQINANNEIAKRNRRSLVGSKEFWDSLPENSQVDLWSGDDDFNILANKEQLEGCSGKDLFHIHRLWVEQYRLLYLLNADLEQVGHYTSSMVFETLLQKQTKANGKASPLLLCSLAAANDPTEGTVFQAFLTQDCLPSQRIQSHLAVLQASFSSAIDSLNQFRLYGKNKGEEGTGLCLVFNRSFFAKPGETSMIAVQKEDDDSSKKEANMCRKLPLYWVLYYECSSGRMYYTPACFEYSLNKDFDVCEDTLKESERKKFQEIGKSLRKIREHFEHISEKAQKAALEMLIYLRHLVKDAAFKDEKELRILSLHSYHDQNSLLKVLPGKNCLSVGYLPVIHDGEEYLEKVIAGPKLRDFANLVDVAKFRLHHLGGKKKVVFRQSQAPLS